VRLTRFARFCS